MKRALLYLFFFQSVRELSKLVCVYRRTPVPIYLVKEEIFSYSPRVSLFYDAITKEEMKYLKNLGLQRVLKVNDFKCKVTAGCKSMLSMSAANFRNGFFLSLILSIQFTTNCRLQCRKTSFLCTKLTQRE